jgi:beta-xylosidase
MLMGTTDWNANIPTAVSTDLLHWTQAPDSLPVLPAWAARSATMTWGPSLLYVGGRWVMYFSTEEAASRLECIGRAVSPTPAGPYVDGSQEPLVCQRPAGGSIDPSVVRTRSGGLYLVWKNDGNATGAPTAIWSQRLNADGSRLLGAAQRLIAADGAWERGVVEAPDLVAADAGGYWLFYSGGMWESPTYGTGLAYCRGALGPCTETSARPFLSTTRSVMSPGALETFTDLHGRLWVAFTALVSVPAPWDPGHDYYNRVLDIAPVVAH